MNVYSDLNLEIELLGAQNILCATLLDPQLFSILNLKDSFFITMEMIEQYAIKKVVLQSSFALLNLPESNYTIVMEVLISGLSSASVKKVANIYIEKSQKEVDRLNLARNILNGMGLDIEFRNFDDRQNAVEWLEE